MVVAEWYQKMVLRADQYDRFGGHRREKRLTKSRR